MRKISCNPHRNVILALALLLAGAGSACAEDNNFYQSNTQYGVSLPNASLPSGSDEVRAADGTSCRSAVGGDGAYIDTGIIGAPSQGSTAASGAIYSRLVIPLGAKPRRLDCASLYELEIQRLKMELDLARMGLSGQTQSTPSAGAGWQDDGWSNVGAAAAPAVAPKVIKPTASMQKKQKTNMIEPVADTQPLAIIAPAPPADSLY